MAEETKHLTFRLLGTTELLLQIRSKESCGILDIKDENLIVDIHFDLITNKDRSTVSLTLTILFLYNNNIDTVPVNLLTFSNVYDFWIQNFDDVIDSKTEGFEIENYPVIIFLGIAISTTRGILIEKCSSTDLRQLIMPVIDPTEIFNKKMQYLNGIKKL